MRRRLQGYDEEVDDWHEPPARSGISIVAREVTVVTKPTGPYRSSRVRGSSFSNDPRYSRNASYSQANARKCSASDNEDFPPYILPGPPPPEDDILPPHRIKNRHGPFVPSLRHHKVERDVMPAPVGYQVPMSQGPYSYNPFPVEATSSSVCQVDLPETMKLETTSCKMADCCRNTKFISGENRGPGGSVGKTNVQYQFCPGVNSSQTYLVVPLRMRHASDDVAVRTAGAVARAASACSAVVVRQKRSAKEHSSAEPRSRHKDNAGGAPSAKKSPSPPQPRQSSPEAKQDTPASPKDLTRGGGGAYNRMLSPSPGGEKSKISPPSAPAMVLGAPAMVLGAPDTPPTSQISKLESLTMVLGQSTVGTQYSQHSDLEIKSQRENEDITQAFPGGTKKINPKASVHQKDHSQFTICDINTKQQKNQEKMTQKAAPGHNRKDEDKTENDVLPSLEDLGPLSIALKDALRLCAELQKVSMMEKEMKAAQSIAQSTDTCQLLMASVDASAGDSTKVPHICSREKLLNNPNENVLHHEIQELKPLQLSEQKLNLKQIEEAQENNEEQQQKLKRLREFELKHIKALRLGLQEHQKLKLQQMREKQDFIRQHVQKLRESERPKAAKERESCNQVKVLKPTQSKNELVKNSKESICKEQLEKDTKVSEQELDGSNKIHRPTQEHVKGQQAKQIQVAKQVHHLREQESINKLVNIKPEQSNGKLDTKPQVKSAEKFESKQVIEIKKQSPSKLKETTQSKTQIIELKSLGKEHFSKQKLLTEPRQIEEEEEEKHKGKEIRVRKISPRKEEAVQKKALSITPVTLQQDMKPLHPSSNQRIAVCSRTSLSSRPPTPYYPWRSTKKLDLSPACSVPQETSQNTNSEPRILSDVSDTYCANNSSVSDIMSQCSLLHSSKEYMSSHPSECDEPQVQDVKQFRIRSSSNKCSTPPPSTESIHERKGAPLRSLEEILGRKSTSKSKELCTYGLLHCRKKSVSRNSRPSSENSHTHSSILNSATPSTRSLQQSSDNQLRWHWPSSQSSNKRLRMHTSAEVVKNFSRDFATSSSSISSECLINLASFERNPSRRLTPTGLPSQLSVARSSSYDMARNSTDRIAEEISKELGSLPSTESSTNERDGKDGEETDKNQECTSRSDASNKNKKQERKSSLIKDARKAQNCKKQRGNGRGRSTRQVRLLLPPASSRSRCKATLSESTRTSSRPGIRTKASQKRRQSRNGSVPPTGGTCVSDKASSVDKSTLRLLPQMGKERWSLRAVTTTTVSGGRSPRRSTRQRAGWARAANDPRNRARSFSQSHEVHSKDRQFSRLTSNYPRSLGSFRPSPSIQRRHKQRKRSSDTKRTPAPRSAPRSPSSRLPPLVQLRGKPCERVERRVMDTLVSQTKLSSSCNSIPSGLSINTCPVTDFLLKNGQETSLDKFSELDEDTIKSQGIRRPQDMIYHIMVEASAAADTANMLSQSRTINEIMKYKKKDTYNKRPKSRKNETVEGTDSSIEGSSVSRPSTFLTKSSGLELPLQKSTPLKIPGMAVNVRTEAEKLLQKLILNNAQREILECEKTGESIFSITQRTKQVT